MKSEDDDNEDQEEPEDNEDDMEDEEDDGIIYPDVDFSDTDEDDGIAEDTGIDMYGDDPLSNLEDDQINDPTEDPLYIRAADQYQQAVEYENSPAAYELTLVEAILEIRSIEGDINLKINDQNPVLDHLRFRHYPYQYSLFRPILEDCGDPDTAAQIVYYTRIDDYIHDCYHIEDNNG